MNARHILEERILTLKRSAHACGAVVFQGEVLGDCDHYFNKDGDEIGYIYRPFFKAETVVTFDVPRKWSQENKEDLIEKDISKTYDQET